MDYMDLEKLHEMKEKGIITEEEFEEKKKAFLESIPNDAEFVLVDPETGEIINTEGNSLDPQLSEGENIEADTSLPMFTPPPNSYSKKGLFSVYCNAFKKSFSFQGRASRYDYWGFYFINFVLSLIFMALAYYVKNNISSDDGSTPTGTDLEKSTRTILYLFGGFTAIGYSIYKIIIIPASFTLFVRRLHDLGKSGWQIILLPLKILVIVLLLLIVFALLGLILGYSGLDANLVKSLLRLLMVSLGFFLLLGPLLFSMLIFFIWQCRKGQVTANKYGAPLTEDMKHDKTVNIFIILFIVITTLIYGQPLIAGAKAGYNRAMEKHRAAQTTQQTQQISNVSKKP